MRPDSPTSKTERICPRCGLVFFSEKPDAMCPACLITNTLDNEDHDDGPAFWEDAPIKKGTPARSFSHFELLNELGRGGMGVVYRARDLNTERIVALKVLQAHHLDVPDLVQRFRSEVRAVSSLDNTYVLPIHEVGEHEGIPFFSMKLTTAGSLAQSIGNYAGKPREAAQLLAKVARGVQHAHERGILHRDLKPGNILLDASGEPYVCDFGLAKWIEDDQKLTMTAAVLGTPHYIAPEQALGSKALTTAVDIYSLGAILYELLTGRPPFVGSTVLETLVASQDKMPDRPSSIAKNVPADLETICLKALEHEPGRRYATAGTFATDLENWLAGRPINARPVNAAEQLWRWAKRNPLPALLVTALIVTIATIAVVATLSSIYIKEKLVQALLSQARVALVSGRAGQRIDALAAIAQATEIRPTMEARNAAITALTLRDLEVKATFPVRKNTNQRLAYAADLKTVVVAGIDHSLKIVDLASHETLHTISGPDSSIAALAHGGSRYAASRNEDECVYLWDLTNLVVTKVLTDCPTKKWSISGLAFDKTETLLAVTDQTSACYIVELSKDLRLTKFRDGVFSQIAFSPDGTRLAMLETTSLETTSPSKLILVDRATEQALAIPLNAPPKSLAWSPKGDLVAVGSKDNNIYIFDASTGQIRTTLYGHRQTINQVLFSHSGDLLASADQDQATRIWDMKNHADSIIYPVSSMEPVLAFSPDDQLLATTDFYQNAVILRLISDSTVCANIPKLPTEDWPALVSSIDFSPDNKLLGIASFAGVQIFEVQTMRRICLLDADNGAEKNIRFDGNSTILVASRISGVTRYQFSFVGGVFSIATSTVIYPDQGFIFGSRTESLGDLVALSSNSVGAIAIIDKKTGAEKRRIADQPEVWDVVAAPDLKWIAASYSGLSPLGVRIWDERNHGSITDILTGQSGIIAVSPDFKTIVTTGQIGPREWDTVVFKETAHTLPQGQLAAFSKDGKLLALTTLGPIELLDTRNFNVVASLQSGTQGLTSSYRVAFSPDGTMLVAQGYDNTVQVWSIVALRKQLAAIHLDWN